jgi:hypothetical protein
MKMHVLALGLMLSVLVMACGGRKTAQDAEGAAPESAESAGKATAARRRMTTMTTPRRTTSRSLQTFRSGLGLA